MNILPSVVVSLLTASFAVGAAPSSAAGSASETYVRTETYPRPPYSGATYYIYERGGAVICTKLEVCNKYGECQVSYRQGQYKDPEDVEQGDAFHSDAPVSIQSGKLRKHVCLVRFRLVPD